jgi:hypothetical protein
MTAQPAWTHGVHWFGDDDLLLMKVSDAGDGVTIWTIHVFEHVGDSSYRLHTEEIPEVSFPVDRVVASLKMRFRRVSTYDAARSRPTPRSERLHFVCTK